MADDEDRPLERRLFDLDRAGLTEQAHDAIDLSLPPAKRDAFRLQRYGVATRPPARPGRRESVAEARARAFVELRKAEVTPRWRSIGPDAIAGVDGSSVSGNVSAVAVDPSNPDHLLVAGSAGGTWESGDGGASWTPRGDNEASTSIGALAFDPANSNVVYCATGDGQGNPGAGLLRSTDGGHTWHTRYTGHFVGNGIFDLKVLPGGQHLLAGTWNGLYVSADGGVTWQRRRTEVTWSLAAVTGVGRGQLLAGCADGVFESLDGGNQWTPVALPTSSAKIWRVAVAIAPSDVSVAYVWAAYDEGVHRLYKRVQGKWTRHPEFDATKLRAGHNWVLAVSPTQPNRVYCGAIYLWRGDIGESSIWTPLSNVNGKDRIHPDFHAIAFDPRDSDVVYAGCDGGLFRSSDAGGTWEHLNHGLVISDVRGLGHDLRSSMLLAGLQDNGSIRRVGRSAWESAQDGDAGNCAIKRNDPNVMVVTSAHMTPAWSESGGTAGPFVRRLPPGSEGEKCAFYPPLHYTADNGLTFAIAGGRLYITEDDGKTWVNRSFPPGENEAWGTALYVPTSNEIYVGLVDGRLVRIRRAPGSGWGTFSPLATPRAGAGPTDLFVHGESMWVTYGEDGGGRVFHSDDGGVTWHDRSPGLPGIGVHSIAVDLRNPRVWVGTDCGVLESRDGGQTWAPFSTNLPNVMVTKIAFHAPMGFLRAGTHSRGVWEVAVDGWPEHAERP